MRDYKLIAEYKYLHDTTLPGGVYIVPNRENIRIWHGILFARRGHYAGGTFRFRLQFPAEYNDDGAYPVVYFTPPVFSPLVDPATGELALRAAFPQWIAAQHGAKHILMLVKRMFYLRDFDPFLPDTLPHQEALALFAGDPPAFLARTEASVRASQEAVYDNPPGSRLRFTEPKPVHEPLRVKILARAAAAEAKPSEATAAGARVGPADAQRAGAAATMAGGPASPREVPEAD
ncbi:unnamed protein product [Phaeothamnion confervicola]